MIMLHDCKTQDDLLAGANEYEERALVVDLRPAREVQTFFAFRVSNVRPKKNFQRFRQLRELFAEQKQNLKDSLTN